MTVATISGRLTDGRSVVVEHDGDHITRVAETDQVEPGWLMPGLVDLQVNGYGGFDVNGPAVTAETIIELRRALATVGTAWFAPTVITAAEGDIVRSLTAVADACEADPETDRAVTWIHVEGPHLSEVDGPRGAHDLTHIRPPDPDEFVRWQQAARGRIGMVTVSPHHERSVDYVRALVAAGVRVAVGHTHAEPAQITAAADAGARFSTHLGNGIQATLPRHPNAIWTQLADDRLTAGFIADGFHLPVDTLRAMIRAKGLDRSFVVSDSVALAGAAPGRHATPVGGQVELSADGRLCVAGTPYLAGAALPLAAAIGTLGRAGFDEVSIERLVVHTPARVAGLDTSQGVGALAVGAPARFHHVSRQASRWAIRGVRRQVLR